MPRSPFHFCICPDPWMAQKEISRLIQASGRTDWSRTTHWGDEPLEPGFWTTLSMPGLLSLLGGGRILVLRRANALTVKIWSDLEPLLRRPKPDLWVVFCLEGEWKGKTPAVPAVLAKQPFFKAARKNGWVWESPGFNEQTMRSELRLWIKSRGITVSGKMENALVGLLPQDGARFGNELEKLELALGERREIGPKDLAVLGGRPEMDIFAFLKVAMRNPADLNVWRAVLKDHEASGSGMLMPFLGLLQREMRILWLLLSGEENKVSLPPFVKNEKKQLARSMGEQGITRIIDLVFHAEMDLKTGRKQADQILEFLVSNLAGKPIDN